jgi:adenine deaminase
MNELHESGNRFVQLMTRNGYAYRDPVYSLLFLTATHLPFIRVTKEGLFLVKEREVVRSVQCYDQSSG